MLMHANSIHYNITLLLRATNMRSLQALTQLMQKANCLEYFADKAVTTPTRDVRCSNCSESGLYHLTCAEECKKCGAKPYHGHLDSCSVYVLALLHGDMYI